MKWCWHNMPWQNVISWTWPQSSQLHPKEPLSESRVQTEAWFLRHWQSGHSCCLLLSSPQLTLLRLFSDLFTTKTQSRYMRWFPRHSLVPCTASSKQALSLINVSATRTGCRACDQASPVPTRLGCVDAMWGLRWSDMSWCVEVQSEKTVIYYTVSDLDWFHCSILSH